MLTIIHLTIQLIYGIPLLFLYLFVIVVILKSSDKKQFQSAFFKLTVIIGIVDLTSYIVVWIHYKLTYCSDTAKSFEGHEKFFLFPIFSFLVYYLPLVRSFLLVLSSANRFTALYQFTWEVKFWSNRWKHLTIACFLIASITTITIPFGNVEYFHIGEYAEIKSSAIVISIRQDKWDPFCCPITNPCQVLAAVFLTFSFNISALFCLIKTIKESNQKNNEIHKAKVGLLVISFWDLIVDLIYILKQIADWLGDQGKLNVSFGWFLFDIQSWTMDLQCLSRPLFFLISSKAIRNEFLHLFGFSQTANNNNQMMLFIRSSN